MSSCFACNGRISRAESDYGRENFAYPICRSCQDYIRSNDNATTTRQSVWLWVELRSRGVPVHLEKWDGYKTIDLAIPEARCNIEVDGRHHQNFDQAFSDLKRMRHSLEKGFVTIRVPNSLVEDATPGELDGIVDELVMCIEAIRDNL